MSRTWSPARAPAAPAARLATRDPAADGSEDAGYGNSAFQEDNLEASTSSITTFSDGGGYSYEALPDGSYRITAAPRPSAVGLVVSEGTAYEAIHELYLRTVPPEKRVGSTPLVDASSSEEGASLEAGDGFWSKLLEDATDGVSEVKEYFTSTWEMLVGWWEGEETEEAKQGAKTPEKTNELQELMARERLSAEEISRARELIAEAPEAEQADLYAVLQSKVAYRNQRNNESTSEESSGGTCNLTSLAMCLEYLGVPNPYPEMQYEDALDKIRIDNNYGPITYASTWSKIAQHLGHEVVEMGGGNFDRSWWVETMQGEFLSKGYGVLASINGHIVRIEGTTDTGVVVDDPYGASVLKGGTSRGWDGFNGTESDGTESGNVGEDHVWPWESVEAFSFKYFRAYR